MFLRSLKDTSKLKVNVDVIVTTLNLVSLFTVYVSTPNNFDFKPLALQVITIYTYKQKIQIQLF